MTPPLGDPDLLTESIGDLGYHEGPTSFWLGHVLSCLIGSISIILNQTKASAP